MYVVSRSANAAEVVARSSVVLLVSLLSPFKEAEIKSKHSIKVKILSRRTLISTMPYGSKVLHYQPSGSRWKDAQA